LNGSDIFVGEGNGTTMRKDLEESRKSGQISFTFGQDRQPTCSQQVGRGICLFLTVLIGREKESRRSPTRLKAKRFMVTEYDEDKDYNVR
jgi:hypothetical protein